MSQIDEVFLGYELYDPQLETDLSASILNWLDRRDLSKLYFYLYRIDVDENQVKQILDTTKLNSEKSLQIARLMINRQLQKLENRT